MRLDVSLEGKYVDVGIGSEEDSGTIKIYLPFDLEVDVIISDEIIGPDDSDKIKCLSDLIFKTLDNYLEKGLGKDLEANMKKRGG
ncbi:MAG: hypothetical protein AMQ22_00024 [Candidatus Methanofastidiosum methylothiophilum]|uniref:Uncharacterized protein n=1 Tax=Candidatus Methanofastidiosum methylothiophilum TaxID=1705564 RepID=A0A150J9L6_9EURY|nr:MAG: hypothetical protein AMQ22_00024 [Candidatus Methanofastidiosum methylthiophilus]